MGDHYFTEKPTTKSLRQNFITTLRGINLTFVSDSGVFSKNDIDFGSRLLLETFRFPDKVNCIADIGCGYGPIGLTLAKECSDCKVTMVDINERALELAAINASLNKINNVIIKKSHLFVAIADEKYDIILTNPPIRAGKDVVYKLFADASRSLTENGEFWLVIQKKQGAPSALKKLESLFKEVLVEKKAKGYQIIRAQKPLT